MSEDINFSELWNQQPVPPLDINALHKKIKQLRSQKLRQLIIANVCLFATIAIMAGIWIMCRPLFWSTKLGIILAVLAMSIFLFIYNKLFPLYRGLNKNMSSREYLDNLLKIKNKERLIQTGLMGLYHLLLLFAIGLYLYEYAIRMPVIMAITVYTVSVGWIAFSWFVIRPKQSKKNNRGNERIITELERIIEQGDEE